MIFKSDKKSLIVWDKEAGKQLAKFVDGEFRSTEASVIQKLQAAGYSGSSEPEDEDEVDTELEQLRERARELGVANVERKGAKRLREEIAEAEAAATGGGGGDMEPGQESGKGNGDA
ncbi:hypothetical protein [Cohnella thailandensis]|uniref:Uncharacterized protein n=1 Tax=Cohnella thailandensis TaxID=557557 RepID=A0A841ST17_9BACL|nr:hypothetical protein [Cohnella thailandensis]MBB6632767.1 hypothetical protein [Cohnella thailandensis]MBP1975544.1 preprotein translocase subunit SecD [Cohnella thailandensis]